MGGKDEPRAHVGGGETKLEPKFKPFTTPPGFKPPTMGEQWRYALTQHPWSRYGLPAAILIGGVVYALGKDENKKKEKV
jgi:hypothetical protein